MTSKQTANLAKAHMSAPSKEEGSHCQSCKLQASARSALNHAQRVVHRTPKGEPPPRGRRKHRGLVDVESKDLKAHGELNTNSADSYTATSEATQECEHTCYALKSTPLHADFRSKPWPCPRPLPRRSTSHRLACANRELGGVVADCTSHCSSHCSCCSSFCSRLLCSRAAVCSILSVMLSQNPSDPNSDLLRPVVDGHALAFAVFFCAQRLELVRVTAVQNLALTQGLLKDRPTMVPTPFLLR